jgi:hypothetical protein
VVGELLELLKRLRAGSPFTAEFATVHQTGIKKRTGDNSAIVPKLSGDLKERRESQQKPLVKDLDGDARIVPFFNQMNRTFEEDIAAIESQTEEANMEKATFEQLWKFSKSLLVDIAAA